MASVTDSVAIGYLSPDKSLAIPQRPQSLISLRLILFKGALRHRLAFHPPPQGWAVFPAKSIKTTFTLKKNREVEPSLIQINEYCRNYRTTSMSQTITAKVDTKLKKRPIDSSQLSPAEVVPVSKGKVYRLDSIKSVGDDHTEVVLSDNAGTWFIFNQHWDGLVKEIVSREQIEAIAPYAPITDEQLADLNACLVRYEITTPDRLRHFLSQTAHESGGFQWLEELADGSDYEGREDLGNIYPGDGRKYKGAGVIQLTGRANYQAFSNAIGDPRVMEGVSYVASTYPFTSAGFFWSENSINEAIDAGADIYAITKIVNGGLNGIDDRIYFYEKACSAI